MGAPAKKTPYALWGFVVPVVLFYAFSFLLIRYSSIPPAAVQQATFTLAVLTGFAIVAVTRRCNAWELFAVGFLQPIVVLIPAALDRPDPLLDGISIRPAVLVGLTCTVSGLSTRLLTTGRLGKENFPVRLKLFDQAVEWKDRIDAIKDALLALGFLASLLKTFWE